MKKTKLILILTCFKLSITLAQNDIIEFPQGIHTFEQSVFKAKKIIMPDNSDYSFSSDVKIYADEIYIGKKVVIRIKNITNQTIINFSQAKDFEHGKDGNSSFNFKLIGKIKELGSLTIESNGQNGQDGGNGNELSNIGRGGNGGKGGDIEFLIDYKGIIPKVSKIYNDYREFKNKKNTVYVFNNGGKGGRGGSLIKKNGSNDYTYQDKISGRNAVSGISNSIKAYFTKPEELKDATKSLDNNNKEFVFKKNSIDKARGKYFALIIGMEDYEDNTLDGLNYPIKYVSRLDNILNTRYDFFDIKKLIDPTKSELNQELENYIEKLRTNDNLLIFYSGHGEYDRKGKTRDGYWLLRESVKGDPESYYNISVFKDKLSVIDCLHILVIADNCYAGKLLDSNKALPKKKRFSKEVFDNLYFKKSRRAIISGNIEKVPDQSNFLDALLRGLENNQQDYFSIHSIYWDLLQTASRQKLPTSPKYETIQGLGDDGGEFIFRRKN